MFRYIKEGRISATLSHSGEKQIEITELLRVFGELHPATDTATTPSNSTRQSHRDSDTTATVSFQIEIARLQAKLDLKIAELDLAKERIAELKSREHQAQDEKNRLISLVEQQALLLSAPPKRSTKAGSKKRSK